MKITILDRVLLLLTGLLAAYQVAFGVEGFPDLPVVAFTIGFGVLLVAGLLLIILGFEILDSPLVVVISTIIPLSLSLGLVWHYQEAWRIPFLIFVIAGFLAIIGTRMIPRMGKLPVVTLALTHGIAGLTIFLLPILLAVQGQVNSGFALVGVGGALIGVGGLLLSFMKMGKAILSKAQILKVLPGLLLLMTLCFVAGFALA